MKRNITKKIEALLSSIYGDILPEEKNRNRTTEEKKEAMQEQRCKSLPFEFIRLIL